MVIDGLPIVPEDSKQKLVKFLLKKLNTVGKTKEDAIFMPLNDKKMSEGCASNSQEQIAYTNSTVSLLLSMRHQSRRSQLPKPFMAPLSTRSILLLLISLLILSVLAARVVSMTSITHHRSSHLPRKNIFAGG